MRRGRAVSVRAAAGAGVICGLAIVVVMATTSSSASRHREPRTATRTHSMHDATAFVETWKASRRATWRLEGEVVRTAAHGTGELRTAVRRVQRPPDELIEGLGSTTGTRGGRRLACTTDAEGSPVCTEGAAVDRAAAIAEEVRLLERYVLGDDRVYDVRRSGDCFELALRVRLPAPPYGRSAMFCFDRVTLAPVRVELRRDEGTEVLRATSHSADVGDEDLEPTTP